MARDRGLLHKSKLDEFKSWLADHGLDYRDGKGAYQVLQVFLPKYGWQAMHEKLTGDHYTIHGPLLKVVNDFIHYS